MDRWKAHYVVADHSSKPQFKFLLLKFPFGISVDAFAYEHNARYYYYPRLHECASLNELALKNPDTFVVVRSPFDKLDAIFFSTEQGKLTYLLILFTKNNHFK
jgi:hypothetical protein